MTFKEINAVFFQNHTKRINTFCGKNKELIITKQVVHIVTTGILKIGAVLGPVVLFTVQMGKFG
jgi:hypothetical protein